MADCSQRTEYLREAKRTGHLGNLFSAHSHALSKLSVEDYAALQAARYREFKMAKAKLAEVMALLLNDTEPKMVNGAMDEQWFKRRRDLTFKASRALERFGNIALNLELGIVRELK